MNFNIFNIIIISGVIQGFLFTAVVLSSKKYRAKSTLFLALLIFTYSLGNLQYMLPDIGAMPMLEMYKYVYLPLATIIPVLIYLYVVKFLFPERRIKGKLWLYLPFLISMVVTIVYRLLFTVSNNHEALFPSYGRFVRAVEIFSVLFSLALVSMAIKKVHSSEKDQKQIRVSEIRTDLTWLKITLFVIWIFTIVWAYLTYLNMFVAGSSPNFYWLWIAIAVTIYWLGHVGIYKYGILVERQNIKDHLEKTSLYQKPTKNQESTANGNSKHLGKLIHLLERDKAYLNPNLTLEIVAEHLQLSPSYVSRIIHEQMHTSFAEYVNSFRIKEVKNYLKNPEFSKYTITSIGLEAGFNSKSSFYDVFKKSTGKTPMAYKKEHLN